MEKHFEIIQYKDGFVVVEKRNKRIVGDYIYESKIYKSDVIVTVNKENPFIVIIAAPKELNLDVPVINWPEESKSWVDVVTDLHNNHGYFQGDNWKVLEQLISKPKIPKGVWLECEEYIDAEEEIKTGKMWNPKLGVLTKDNKVIPLRWEW